METLKTSGYLTYRQREAWLLWILCKEMNISYRPVLWLCAVWLVADYELEKREWKLAPRALPRTSCSSYEVTVCWTGGISYRTNIWGHFNCLFKYAHKIFFYRRTPRRVADYIRLHSGRWCRLSLSGARSGVGEYSSSFPHFEVNDHQVCLYGLFYVVFRLEFQVGWLCGVPYFAPDFLAWSTVT